MKSGLCIKKGEEIQIHAYVSGSPYPKVTWLRNNEDVTKEPTKKVVPVLKKKKKTKVCVPRSLDKVLTGFLFWKNGEIYRCSRQVLEPEEEFVTPLRERLGLDQTQKGQSVLMIREAVRADHGNFTIHVENAHGVASASCPVNVLGNSFTV